MLETKQVRVPVDGGELSAECVGLGPPVVLLHGGLLDASMWDEQLEPLAAAHTVVRYDARSHGRSSTAVGDYRDDDDLLSVLDAFDLPAAALVGLSMGGRTAADFALVHPDGVTGMVLAGPGISPMRFTDPFVLEQLAEQAAAIEAWDAERYVQAFLRYGVDGARRGPADTDSAVRHRCAAIARANVAAHHTAVGAALERDAMARLEDIATPTLLLIGELELPDVRRVVDEAARRLPNATRLEIPGAGHMLNLERPDLFTAAVLDHLGSVLESGQR